MKIALLLLVAVIMMMVQESDSRRIARRRRIVRRLGYVPVRRFGSRTRARVWCGKTRGCCSCGYSRGCYHKRDADFDAAYNAASEDGVFTDEEIKSVFDVDENGLAEFKEKFDVNGDGVVKVEELEPVNTISSNVDQDE